MEGGEARPGRRPPADAQRHRPTLPSACPWAPGDLAGTAQCPQRPPSHPRHAAQQPGGPWGTSEGKRGQLPGPCCLPSYVCTWVPISYVQAGHSDTRGVFTNAVPGVLGTGVASWACRDSEGPTGHAPVPLRGSVRPHAHGAPAEPERGWASRSARANTTKALKLPRRQQGTDHFRR